MKQLAIVSLLGLLGVLLRYWMNIFTMRTFSANLPIATFVINISGAFLIGILYVLGLERSMISPDLRAGLMGGFLGGFTTFSAFCMESVSLLESGRLIMAAAYIIASPVLGLFACYAGLWLARFLVKL